MRSVRALALGVLVLAAGSTPAAAQQVDGKSTAFDSTTVSNVSLGTATRLVATIAKGRKGSVLSITAMITTASGADATFTMAPTVNELPVLGGNASKICVPSETNCTLTGSWWLDLDQAEENNPGQIAGQPLDVRLVVTVAGDPDITANFSMNAIQVRK